MKLLTHNMLKSHVKGVKNGYPLLLRVRLLARFFLSLSLTAMVLSALNRVFSINRGGETFFEKKRGGKRENDGEMEREKKR